MPDIFYFCPQRQNFTWQMFFDNRICFRKLLVFEKYSNVHDNLRQNCGIEICSFKRKHNFIKNINPTLGIFKAQVKGTYFKQPEILIIQIKD